MPVDERELSLDLTTILETYEMSKTPLSATMTNYRWRICSLLFFATTINYMDRQVLSLTWKDFIAPEFHWTNADYGNITALFSIFYAFSMLFAGRFVDWLDTKKGFLCAIGVWSLGAVLHAFCGIATSGIVAGDWLVIGWWGLTVPKKPSVPPTTPAWSSLRASVCSFLHALFLRLGSREFPCGDQSDGGVFSEKRSRVLDQHF